MTRVDAKQFTTKVRRSMAAHHIKPEVIAAILAEAKKVDRPIKLPKKATKRIIRLLAKPGDKAIVMRTNSGIRVFSAEGQKTLSMSAKANKPWLKSSAIGKTAPAKKAPAKVAP